MLNFPLNRNILFLYDQVKEKLGKLTRGENKSMHAYNLNHQKEKAHLMF